MDAKPKKLDEIDIIAKTFDCQQLQLIEVRDPDGKRWKAVTVFVPIEEDEK